METSVSGSDLAPSRSYARVRAAGWASRPASIIAAATVASCGSPDRVDTSVADSAGVAIVTNSGEPGLLDWTLDTTLVFGGDETGPATFYQVRPALVDVDSRGRIYVLEPGEYRVTVFDSTGVALALMGRGDDRGRWVPGPAGGPRGSDRRGVAGGVSDAFDLSARWSAAGSSR